MTRKSRNTNYYSLFDSVEIKLENLKLLFIGVFCFLNVIKMDFVIQC